MYGLCDCNNFFASCERVFNPSLEGKPVVVLSSNDGCIIARSNESKALGIKMGQPLFQAQQIIRANNVAVYSSNMQLYGDMSHRVMATLKGIVPSTEIYSIDEAFINFEGLPQETLQEQGREIARIVMRNTGIPVSIGIAPTKTLAKVASKLCKQYPKLNGCCLMYRHEDIEKVLSTYPIEDVWGIGRRYSKMLQGVSIHTALDFTKAEKEWIKAKMGIGGLRTWRELQGEQCIGFQKTPPDKQSICVSRSFAKELYDFEPLHTAISTFVSSAAEKLRKQGSAAGQMLIFIYTNRHHTQMPQYYESRLIRFDVATDSTLEMLAQASKALRFIFDSNYGYKKAGVILSDIVPKTAIQNTLFDTTDRTKHTRLMQAIDSLNAHHGRNTVSVATQTLSPIKTNRDHLSPHYTTQWSEIITVKI